MQYDQKQILQHCWAQRACRVLIRIDAVTNMPHSIFFVKVKSVSFRGKPLSLYLYQLWIASSPVQSLNQWLKHVIFEYTCNASSWIWSECRPTTIGKEFDHFNDPNYHNDLNLHTKIELLPIMLESVRGSS